MHSTRHKHLRPRRPLPSWPLLEPLALIYIYQHWRLLIKNLDGRQRARIARRGKNRCPGIDGATRRPSPTRERGTLEGQRPDHSMEQIKGTSVGTFGNTPKGCVPVCSRFPPSRQVTNVPNCSRLFPFVPASLFAQHQLRRHGWLDDDEAIERLFNNLVIY